MVHVSHHGAQVNMNLQMRLEVKLASNVEPATRLGELAAGEG